MEVKPFLKYPGGKRRIARRIIELLPKHKLYCYVEPFGGMGAVLLAKERSVVEVWNDIDGGLANVMRVVKYHADALDEELQWMLYQRAEREHWLAYQGETDIQRAARWIMVRQCAFQGRFNKGFHVNKSINANIKSREMLIEQMRAVSKRLSGVLIENLDWQRVFDLYDSPDAVFFCDPPYADGDQEMYLKKFDEDQHRLLADRLRSIQGRWILTYGDNPLIRELYDGCVIEEVRRVRTINQSTRREYVELIIRNYTIVEDGMLLTDDASATVEE